jgi:hypothetical protein
MHTLSVYNEILFGTLRPWKVKINNDRVWETKLSELKKNVYSFQPHYTVSLPGNLINIRKYYSLLIENEAIEYLNDFHKEMKKAVIKEEKQYLLNRALKSKINQMLKDIDQIITLRRYSLDYILTIGHLSNEEVTFANESYILFLLKYQSVRIFKELRLVYENSLNISVLTDEELMFKYFRENTENLRFITDAEKVESLGSVVIYKPLKSKADFTDKPYDFREQKKGVLSYEQMVKNPQLFSIIEEYFYENDIIDKDFIFRESKQGMTKIKFAALVHQMIHLKYFKSIVITPKKKIDDLDIRKFINHRYQTDIDKQYRDLRNDEEKLKKTIDEDYFIGNIGIC